MKRILPLVLLLCLVASPVCAWQGALGVGGGSPAAAVDPCACTPKTYLGQLTEPGTGDTGDAGYTFGLRGADVVNVEGTGTYTVCELSVYSKGSGGVRLAIYDADPTVASPAVNLVCQGTGAVAVSGASYTWQGHLISSDIQDAAASTPCLLTKGADYYIAVTIESNSTYLSYSSIANAGFTKVAYYGATGFPEEVNSWTASGTPYTMRLGYCP